MKPTATEVNTYAESLSRATVEYTQRTKLNDRLARPITTSGAVALKRLTDDELEHAVDALYEGLRRYDFFQHWPDDAVRRQAAWAVEHGVDRAQYMRLVLFAAGEWMVSHMEGFSRILMAINGVPDPAWDNDDLPF